MARNSDKRLQELKIDAVDLSTFVDSSLTIANRLIGQPLDAYLRKLRDLLAGRRGIEATAGAILLKQGNLDQLRVNIPHNLEQYQSAKPWLASYFGAFDWHWSSNKVQAPALHLSLPSNGTDISRSDLESTKAVYGALKHLPPLRAADPRFWARPRTRLIGDYMRLRWPLEGYRKRFPSKDPASFLRDRYFFTSNSARALVHDGLARL